MGKWSANRQPDQEPPAVGGELGPEPIEPSSRQSRCDNQRALETLLWLCNAFDRPGSRQVQVVSSARTPGNRPDRRLVQQQPCLRLLHGDERDPLSGEFASGGSGSYLFMSRPGVWAIRISVYEDEVGLGLILHHCTDLVRDCVADTSAEPTEVWRGSEHLIGARLNAQVLKVLDQAFV